MPVAAGSLSESLSLLRDTLAASPCWRACCANATASWSTIATAIAAGPAEGTAKTRIGYGEIADPSADLPRALVKHMADETVTRETTSGHDGEGVKLLVAWFSVPEEYADNNGFLKSARATDCYLDMTNRIGTIRNDLVTAWRDSPDGVMCIHRVDIADCGGVDLQNDHNGPPKISEFQAAFIVYHYTGED